MLESSVARGRLSAVRGVKYHTLATPVPLLSELLNVWDPTASWNTVRTVSGRSLASVPGMLNPVSYHPLLTGASLDHQAKAKVGIFGHFYLQAPTSVPADDWTILQQTHMKVWPNPHNNKKQMVETLTPRQWSCTTEVSVCIGSVMSTKVSAAKEQLNFLSEYSWSIFSSNTDAHDCGSRLAVSCTECAVGWIRESALRADRWPSEERKRLAVPSGSKCTVMKKHCGSSIFKKVSCCFPAAGQK